MKIREIETKYKLRESALESKLLDSPNKVATMFRSIYTSATEEHFITIFLNNKNKCEGYTLVSKGTLNEAIIHPREVFKAAVLLNAASIIIAHNHPSGDLTPSREDLEVTKRLIDAGKILGVRVQDHVIVDCNEDGRFLSIRSDFSHYF